MIGDLIEAPLSREELVHRWQARCADPTFEDMPGKIELTEWAEIMISPVGKTHGLVSMRVAQPLRRRLGGQTMAEVGIATSIGVRAPDVAWCSDDHLANHPEEAPLSSAPELCVEVASASNALPKLRDKALAYCRAGAVEAWTVFPHQRRMEVYGTDGRRDASSYGIGIEDLIP